MPMGNMASAIITLTKLRGNLSSLFMMSIIIEGGCGYFYGGEWGGERSKSAVHDSMFGYRCLFGFVALIQLLMHQDLAKESWDRS